MKTIIVGLISFLVVSTSFAEKLPIESFLKRDPYQGMKLSPDGKYMASLLLQNEKVMLIITDRKTGKVTGGVNPGNENELHSFTWVNNTRVTYELAEKRHYSDEPISTGELFGINFDGSENETIFGHQASDARLGTRIKTKSDSKASLEIVSLLENDKENILIAEYPWEKRGYDYYDTKSNPPTVSKLNVYSGARKKVEFIPYRNANILATKDGKINFVYWSDESLLFHGSYRENEKSPWIDISEVFDVGQDALPVAIDQEGKKVFVEAVVDDVETIFEIELKSKKITQHFNLNRTDIYDWLPDIDTGTPAVGYSNPSKVEYHYPNTELRTASWHKTLSRAFNGSLVEFLSWTKDGKEIIVYVSSDVNAGEYYLFNTEAKKVDLIHANLQWLDPRNMRTMQAINLTARDKKIIPALLTLPDTPKAPLIVLPHGGPHAHDSWGFDKQVQMLANQGYAVLQVNFRGSTGYGTAHRTAGYREWGGKMIEDIIDASQSVIQQELVDGNNVCIFGASYGAYAALMSAAKEPDLFKCAVGYAGIYDLEYLYSKGDIRIIWGGEGYLERTIGKDLMQLKDFSPINHTDKIKANVMLIHGDEDNRSPIAHAEAMKKSLESKGKNVNWQYFGLAGHGVWNNEDQVKLYTSIIEFFDENLKK